MKNLVFNKLKELNKSYTVTGRDYILTSCLNPVHNDSKPSMGVNLKNGYAKCFTCGFTVSPKFFTEGLDESQIIDLERKAIYSKIKEQFNNTKAMRGTVILPPKSDTELPENWRGVSKDILKEVGAYICDIGKFQNRIIFPINEYSYTSRYLGEVPKGQGKWIHSKGFKHYDDVYIKINKGKPLVLVEGLHDALLLYQKGYSVICNFGLAPNIIQESIVAKLLAHNIDTVHIMFDEDEAGRGATSSLFTKYLSSDIRFIINLKHARLLDGLKDYYESSFKDYGEYYESKKEQ
jgi:DNA primase